MKILHRIAFIATDADRRDLARLGVKVRSTGLVPAGFIDFDASESEENWPLVRDWIERRGLGVHSVRTVFSKREIDAAQWLALGSIWHHGYPQPEDDFGYLRTTYDAASYCEECGTGAVQKAAFAMAGEPKWGTRGILQLNWVFDEFFVKPDVFDRVFAPLGIESWAVHNRRGQVLRSALQLAIVERVCFGPGLPSGSKCPACGRIKYSPAARGTLPPLRDEPSSHISRSAEWFGSGGEAHNQIIVSQALARAIVAADVKGVSFRPLAAAADGAIGPA